MTARSLTGDFGRSVQRYSLELLDQGLVHVVASDAHAATGRDPHVLPILGEVLLRRGTAEPLLGWLTQDVPAAILADAPLPPRPSQPRRRRTWKLLARRLT